MTGDGWQSGGNRQGETPSSPLHFPRGDESRPAIIPDILEKSFKAVIVRACKISIGIGRFEKSTSRRFKPTRRGIAGQTTFFKTDERTFLAPIGCTPQELYDFVEDWCEDEEPSFETVLLITAVRRDYLLVVQKGHTSREVIKMDSSSRQKRRTGRDRLAAADHRQSQGQAARGNAARTHVRLRRRSAIPPESEYSSQPTFFEWCGPPAMTTKR